MERPSKKNKNISPESKTKSKTDDVEKEDKHSQHISLYHKDCIEKLTQERLKDSSSESSCWDHKTRLSNSKVEDDNIIQERLKDLSSKLMHRTKHSHSKREGDVSIEDSMSKLENRTKHTPNTKHKNSRIGGDNRFQDTTSKLTAQKMKFGTLKTRSLAKVKGGETEDVGDSFERLLGFRSECLTSWSKFVSLLSRPSDPASLGVLRFCYGKTTNVHFPY